MIKFDDEGIQKEWNECRYRKTVGGVDICFGMCQPCGRAIENGQCTMLTDYFSKQKGKDGDHDVG